MVDPFCGMPLYRSHKVVRALPIKRFTLWSTEEQNLITFDFDDSTSIPLVTSADVVARYMPKPGDYLVRYEDGYLSISPKQAFEDGYTRVP